jgi:hypothetical protein
VQLVFDLIYISYSMHMPAFWCDGEYSFCIIKFGGKFWYLNKPVKAGAYSHRVALGMPDSLICLYSTALLVVLLLQSPLAASVCCWRWRWRGITTWASESVGWTFMPCFIEVKEKASIPAMGHLCSALLGHVLTFAAIKGQTRYQSYHISLASEQFVM